MSLKEFAKLVFVPGYNKPQGPGMVTPWQKESMASRIMDVKTEVECCDSVIREGLGLSNVSINPKIIEEYDRSYTTMLTNLGEHFSFFSRKEPIPVSEFFERRDLSVKEYEEYYQAFVKIGDPFPILTESMKKAKNSPVSRQNLEN